LRFGSAEAKVKPGEVMMKSPYWAFLLVAIGLCGAVSAQDTAIYQQGGSALYEAISSAVKAEHVSDGSPAPLGPISVSSDPAQAQKDIKGLEAKGAKYFYAIGPAAANLATQSGSAGVYIYVPNPAGSGLLNKAKWAGVSPYPEPRLVLQHIRSAMKVQRIAVLYTRKNNEEVAQVFDSAAAEEKIPCKLVGLRGPEELQTALGPALKQADALLILLDPIAFNSDSIRYVVNTCIQEKKPVIGFMDSVASSGVPFAIYPPADEIAKTAGAALKALKTKNEDRKIRYPQRFVMSINENAVKTIGASYDAQKVVKKY
jgi:ABC-type uncharacterized transport system substrate-binding protein